MANKDPKQQKDSSGLSERSRLWSRGPNSGQRAGRGHRGASERRAGMPFNVQSCYLGAFPWSEGCVGGARQPVTGRRCALASAWLSATKPPSPNRKRHHGGGTGLTGLDWLEVGPSRHGAGPERPVSREGNFDLGRRQGGGAYGGPAHAAAKRIQAAASGKTEGASQSTTAKGEAV